VYNCYKDGKGYLWFATDKGISKFDGQYFKNFTVAEGLGDAEIFKTYEDHASLPKLAEFFI
jgi:ligand-binding sensor domain-containing protein